MKKNNIYKLVEDEYRDYEKVCDYCNIGYPIYSFELKDYESWICSFCGRRFRKIKK